MKKLVVLFLLVAVTVRAATVSAPTIVEVSPLTPPTSPLYLTNVLKNLSNNMIIRLLPGTHTVQVFPGSSGNLGRDAHMRLLLKTNITIEGLGPQSVIYHAQTGNVFSVALCDNITFKNFSIIGTRPVGTPPNTELFAAFNCESNRAVVWDGLIIKNQFDHGIVNFGTKVSEDCTVKNCWFESCGNTNNWPASGYPGDGTCIHVIGSRMQILNNTFTNCGLAIEFEGESGSAGFRNILIAENKFIAGLEPCIIHYDSGPALDGMYSDITIQNNVFKYLAGHGVGDTKNAMQLSQAERMKIIGNHIEGAYSGLYYFAPYHVVGGIIANNTFKDMTVWGIVLTSSDTISDLQITGNIFTNMPGDGIITDFLNRSTISDNVFNDVSDGGITGLGAIRIRSSDSNSIVRNVFGRVKGGGALYMDANCDRNVVEGNQFWHWTTAPYTDLGTENLILPNIIAGALTGAVPKTNTFVVGAGTPGGTNVFIDLARAPVQVLDVTNTCLLIITNTAGTALHGGKQVTLTLYNNKATNMGVYFSTANRRPLGQDIQSMISLAATHHSLTGAQSARLQFEIHGTNYSVLANHQR